MPQLTSTGISYTNSGDYTQDSSGAYVQGAGGTTYSANILNFTSIPSTANKVTLLLANGGYSGGPQSPYIKFYCNGVAVNVDLMVNRITNPTGTTGAIGYTYTNNPSAITASPYQTLTHIKLEAWRVRQWTYLYRWWQQFSNTTETLTGFGRFSGAGDLNQVEVASHNTTAYPWSSITYRLYYE